MTLAPGTKLGSYEILGPLGAGGMGEVYRARDPRLDRDVAVKVLPEEFFEGEERRQRFEREAKLLASLNHPGIAALYSFEEIPSSSSPPLRHILVMELLEGETLRAALAGAKRLDAEGARVRAADRAGPRGRAREGDRPPGPEARERLRHEGRAVKILDFGLAKLAQPGGGRAARTCRRPTRGTEPGVVMGTLGYMSPEQVKGKPADARSRHLLASGRSSTRCSRGSRAFQGDTAAETISAILKEDPPDLSATNQNVPPGLERLVAHCLEKNPEQRFHSAHDLAFDLESLSGSSAHAGMPAVTAREGRSSGRSVPPRSRSSSAWAWPSFFAGRGSGPAGGSRNLTFKPLTFRSLPIFRALFAPDGQDDRLQHGAGREQARAVHARSRVLRSRGRSACRMRSSCRSRRKARSLCSTHARYVYQRLFTGTLARMPLGGGAPREVLEGVREADWSPDGESLAIIREVDGKDRLEYPIGKVLYTTGGYLSDLRFSPGGDRIAFLEHPYRWDDRGGVAVVDLAGKKTDLAESYWGEQGLAWSPDGKEILFSAGRGYASFDVRAVTLTNRTRVALPNAGG